jgi:peptide/nickel transport system substrate-binding protein
MNTDLKIVDPVWTTVYVTRNHGYMVYDTLFGLDANREPKPQMVDTFTVSEDGLTYTFTLRDGLLWHDGAPVTAEDCVASIKRWGARDSMGQKLMSLSESWSVVDAKTFVLKLKEKTGLVIPALAKPSASPLFMMPKRVADTDPNKQISEFVGSGPFVFKTDEWKPGDKAVYVKFEGYKPRSEPPSALAGGKVVKVDRVEWRAISDQQQAVNALLAGEIDFIEQPPHDLHGLLKADANIKMWTLNPLGSFISSAPTTSTSPSTIPRSAARCGMRSTRRTSCARPSAMPSTTRCATPSTSAAPASSRRRAWTGCSPPTSRRRGRSSRLPATTARLSC